MTKCLQCRANEARGLEYREQARSQAEMGTEPFLSTLHSVRWEEHRLSLHFKECLHRLPEELDVNGRRSKSEPTVLSQLTHFLPPGPPGDYGHVVSRAKYRESCQGEWGLQTER